MISVIIPTYNEEKNIERCLFALQNQTISRDKYEIIVVDGHSKDMTVKLAKRYADKVVFQKSKGVGGARNDGVAAAKGDIIATTDADCIVPKDWVERILNDFKVDRTVVGVYGPVKPIENKLKYKIFLAMNNLLAYFLYILNLAHMSVGANTAFRKKDFLDIGGYADYSAGDDYEMPFRLKKKGKILFDKRLFVSFSMRRYELFGTINALYTWFINVINDVFGIKKEVRKYNHVDYELNSKQKMSSKLKIYISCNGLGLGHVGRILSVANVLKDRGDKVIFGTWGPAVEFARKKGFFCHELQPIDWKDKEDGSFDLTGTAVRAPLIILKMIRLIFEEIAILQKENPDVIISDGAVAHISGRILGIPAVYVDHQMDFPLKSRIIKKIVKQIHNLMIKMGKRVAVLDLKPPNNIYPFSITDIRAVTYTGPLVGSRPDDHDTQTGLKKKLKVSGKLCVIMISGPKHSPIALEEKILEIEPELMKMKGWTFIVKVPKKHGDRQNIRYITWIDDVYELLKASDVVVSRAGYTTVCDILAFDKKSILIPQPKQVEQETLAKYLKEKKIAEAISQDELQALPGLIRDILNRGIDAVALGKMSGKINESDAKRKIAMIIDEIAGREEA